MYKDTPSGESVQFVDVAPALEFVCWAVVALAPLLRLVNGAAVTGDQFVIQISLFVAAMTAAVCLRFYQVRHRKDICKQDATVDASKQGNSPAEKLDST
jgi:hypothetical protein